MIIFVNFSYEVRPLYTPTTRLLLKKNMKELGNITKLPEYEITHATETNSASNFCLRECFADIKADNNEIIIGIELNDPVINKLFQRENNDSKNANDKNTRWFYFTGSWDEFVKKIKLKDLPSVTNKSIAAEPLPVFKPSTKFAAGKTSYGTTENFSLTSEESEVTEVNQKSCVIC